MTDEPAIYTREILEALRTRKGGWDRETLAVLGVAWPPRKGWKRRLVGTVIPVDLRWLMGNVLMGARRRAAEADRGPYCRP